MWHMSDLEAVVFLLIVALMVAVALELGGALSLRTTIPDRAPGV